MIVDATVPSQRSTKSTTFLFNLDYKRSTKSRLNWNTLGLCHDYLGARGEILRIELADFDLSFGPVLNTRHKAQ